MNSTNETPERIEMPWGTFTIADKIPEGYYIWNVGVEYADQLPEGYIPFCREAQTESSDNSKSPKSRQLNRIDMNALIAVKLNAENPEARKMLMTAANFGCLDVETFVLQRLTDTSDKVFNKFAQLFKSLPWDERRAALAQQL